MLIAAALWLVQDDAAAEKLLRAAQERIASARTLRAAVSYLAGGRADPDVKARTRFLVKGGDRWRLEIDAGSRGAFGSAEVDLLCDGRTVRSLKPGTPAAGRGALGPSGGAAAIREGLQTTSFATVLLLQSNDFLPQGRGIQGRIVLEKIKDGGPETRDGRQLRIVHAAVRLSRVFGNDPLPLRIHIDPVDRRIVRRELDLFGTTLVETIEEFAIDEDIPDAEFAFQTLKRLNRARAEQAAAGVDLFTRYTGRLPRGLDELAARPAWLEPDVFWPDGGFTLGRPPVDPWGRPYEFVLEQGRPALAGRGADAKPGGRGDAEDVVVPLRPATGRAVGAPSERLRRHFETRVRLHVLAAAVAGYTAAYGELPRKKAALWEKGAEAEVWPEGGWLPAGLPADGWGETIRMISEKDVVRLQVLDPRTRRLGPKELTPEERAGLEGTAALRLSADERTALGRLMDVLRDDDFEKRDKADEALRAKGPAAIAPLEERLKTEEDAEARARLGMIRKSLRIPPAAWPRELGLLTMSVLPAGRETGDALRTATTSLKTLASAQADFRANDRDGNKVQDFWTGDVAGLYTVRGADQESVKLIELSVAAADAAPLNDGAALAGLVERGPRQGYLFRAMAKDPDGPYDTGTHRHPSKFGFCAYPEDYGAGGTMTAILNENNTIFVKDTGGEPVLEWPNDQDLRTWSKLD